MGRSIITGIAKVLALFRGPFSICNPWSLNKMRSLRLVALLFAFFHRAMAFPNGYGQFSTFPLSSPNGSFTFPNFYPIILRENNTYEITWTTTFDIVVLMLHQRGKAGGYIEGTIGIAS